MITKSQTRVSIVIVVLLCSVAVARAQDPSTQAPAGVRTLSPTTPFQLILPSKHLLGDWHGQRGWLEERGFTPTLTFVTDALGNPSGGMRHGFTGFSNVGFNLVTDLEKLYGPKGGAFEFSISYRFERSLSHKYIGNTFNVQQVCC